MAGFEKRIGMADHAGTCAQVEFDTDSSDEPRITLCVEAGYCGGTGFPTPEAARQIAGALLEAADLFDEMSQS